MSWAQSHLYTIHNVMLVFLLLWG